MEQIASLKIRGYIAWRDLGIAIAYQVSSSNSVVSCVSQQAMPNTLAEVYLQGKLCLKDEYWSFHIFMLTRKRTFLLINLMSVFFHASAAFLGVKECWIGFSAAAVPGYWRMTCMSALCPYSSPGTKVREMAVERTFMPIYNL